MLVSTGHDDCDEDDDNDGDDADADLSTRTLQNSSIREPHSNQSKAICFCRFLVSVSHCFGS